MVFISYNEKDKEYVSLLKTILEKNKKEVLNISDKIKPGDNIIDKITESINLCNKFIFLISKSVENSKWVNIELTLALSKSINNGKVIILPIIINNANIPLYLERYLCLKINDKEDLIKKENIIIDSINNNESKNTLENAINYLDKEKQLLDKMIQIEENKRKIKNKYQALIFSIIVTLLLISITALNLITEKINIMNSVLNVLYGFCIGLFTSILLSSIRRLRRGGKNA